MIFKAVFFRRFVSVAGTALLSLASVSWSAVPVEESRPTSTRAGSSETFQPRPAADEAPAGGGGGLSALFYELQILQQEVQELRGMLEEQSHRLDRLARDQQEQYLDLDRRMQALRSGGAPATSQPQDDEQDVSPSSGGAGATASSGGRPTSEREAYAAAFDLMKDRQFDASVEAFNRLVLDYPNGVYTPNAFYWLGELHLAREENERARQSFAQVVNLYPDHQKVPDALYKLGVVYHRLGDVERAREYLNQVRREHPQSSAAGLAQTYLAEL